MISTQLLGIVLETYGLNRIKVEARIAIVASRADPLRPSFTHFYAIYHADRPANTTTCAVVTDYKCQFQTGFLVHPPESLHQPTHR